MFREPRYIAMVGSFYGEYYGKEAVPLKRDDNTEGPAHGRETPAEENPVEPERRLVKMGFVSKVWGFLRRPATTFRAVREDTLSSALKYALICLVILGAAAGIIDALTGPNLLFELGLGRLADRLLSILITIAGGMIFICVGGAWTHLWVKLLGGRPGCSYRQTMKALAYGATPAYLLGWVPVVLLVDIEATDLIWAKIAIWAFSSIWAFVLTIIGLRELQGITTRRAAAVYLVATVIVGILISFWAVLSLLALFLYTFAR